LLTYAHPTIKLSANQTLAPAPGAANQGADENRPGDKGYHLPREQQLQQERELTVVREIRAGHRVGRRSKRRQERVICSARGQIINTRQELVQLADKIDWDFVDGEIAPAPLYSDNGRPGRHGL